MSDSNYDPPDSVSREQQEAEDRLWEISRGLNRSRCRTAYDMDAGELDSLEQLYSSPFVLRECVQCYDDLPLDFFVEESSVCRDCMDE